MAGREKLKPVEVTTAPLGRVFRVIGASGFHERLTVDDVAPVVTPDTAGRDGSRAYCSVGVVPNPAREPATGVAVVCVAPVIWLIFTCGVVTIAALAAAVSLSAVDADEALLRKVVLAVP